jgi:hypothetical protein
MRLCGWYLYEVVVYRQEAESCQHVPWLAVVNTDACAARDADVTCQRDFVEPHSDAQRFT